MDVVYLRLVEELAELAEAVRIYHLYPKNFENELADFFAWWFALSHLTGATASKSKSLERLLWEAYPAQCLDCNSMPCFCPPGPMRELMSKPALGQYDTVDALTSLNNQGTFNYEVNEIQEGKLAAAFPIACVRIDVDDFKKVNDTHGHFAGDEALKHVAATLRKKARTRDRLYRAGGDEFTAILTDCTEEEGVGLMKRFLATLHAVPVRWVSPDGRVVEFSVTASIGVSECMQVDRIKEMFEAADKAAMESKQNGKNRITKTSSST